MLSIEICDKVAKGSSVNKTGRKKKKRNACGYVIYIIDKVKFIK